MLGILEKNGFTFTADEAQADVLIVNTCGFIEPAKEESIDTMLSLSQYKENGRLKLLVATGCLTQRYEKDLLKEMPEVDLMMGVNQYERLPQAILEALGGKRASYCADDHHILSGDRVLTTPPYMAYVRIADGCDNRCSYCAIPLIRGGFRSRTMDDVLAEIRALAERRRPRAYPDRAGYLPFRRGLRKGDRCCRSCLTQAAAIRGVYLAARALLLPRRGGRSPA